jgi:hypothetical protein
MATKKPAKNVRSSVSGRYVKPAAAKTNPRETEVESRKPRKSK